MGDQWNNSHRAFLQAFVARNPLTFDEAKPLLAAIISAHQRREILTEDITQADFNAYVTATNDAISIFDLEIRSTYHQTTRSRVYALINSTSDAITQLATIHTADEISFLKRVLDAMFETYNTQRHEVMAITSMQAIKLHKAPNEDGRQETQNNRETQGSTGQSLTMGQAERTMKTLLEEGWFEKSQKGYYSLSPRALMELRGWLIGTYNEEDAEEEDSHQKIKTCEACKEIITTVGDQALCVEGQRCPKRSCPLRLHDICTQSFFRTQPSKKCPRCKTDWTGKDFVGERAASVTKPQARRNGNGAVASGQSPFLQAENQDQENEDLEEADVDV
ncbi:hypothetical protein MMC21_005817 [Puttea exsequens]|nr:hypothetical protein [Puttea exsequens]